VGAASRYEHSLPIKLLKVPQLHGGALLLLLLLWRLSRLRLLLLPLLLLWSRCGRHRQLLLLHKAHERVPVRCCQHERLAQHRVDSHHNII
jgi:hypothetical protein